MNPWTLVMIPIGYLAGSFPTAYLLGRVRGMDLRAMGSGSIGGSNAGQFMGMWAFLLVAAVDIGKAVIVVQLALLWSGDILLAGLTGLAAMIGHNWPIFLHFVGGRGVGTTLGTLLVLFPPGWLVLLLPPLVGKPLHREALGTAIGFIALPFVAGWAGQPVCVIITCVGAAVITAIKRLLANGAPLPEKGKRTVLLNRLLHDRDVGPDEEWVARAP